MFVANSSIRQAMKKGSRHLLAQSRFNHHGSSASRALGAFSTWQYPENPWRQETPEERRKAQERVKRKRQLALVNQSVQTAVRYYLEGRFPNEFSMKSNSQYFWQDSKKGGNSLTGRAQTLLSLNGFRRVHLPKPFDSLELAEGVVALPNFYSRLRRADSPEKQFQLYAQPQDPQPKRRQEQLPPIVQEDIRLYRLLENRAADFINARNGAILRLYQRLIEEPLMYLSRRIREVYMQTALPELIQKKLPELIQKKLRRTSSVSPRVPSKGRASYSSSATQDLTKDSYSGVDVQALPVSFDKEDEYAEPLENLLVLQSGTQSILWSDMTESTRLVALPHSLRHKSASTLISCSLVLFGAIPLAYRSYNYAVLYEGVYPGLSEALAASVIGTITYGILSQRYNARRSQSYTVANAMLHRVHARDDTVLLALQEGAVRRLSRAIQAEYFHYLGLDEFVEDEEDEEDDELLLRQSAQLARNSSVPLVPSEFVDPLDLAIQFGLLVKEEVQEKKEEGGESPPKSYQAVALGEAPSRVLRNSLDARSTMFGS